jgi:hypothetical protein
MGERDAFGRETDEDTLREMGWRAPRPAAVTPGDPLAAPEPATTVLAAPEAPAPFVPAKPAPAAKPPRPPARSFARRRRRPGPSLARLLILAAILGVGFVVVSRAIDAGRDAVERIGGGARTPSGSLLRPAALRAALARLPRGRLVQSLRVAPDRINALVVSGTTSHSVQIRAAGGVVDVKAPAGPKQAALPRVAAGAPARIVRVAARRAGRSAADVDHLVLTRAGWLLVFKDGGPRYRATPAGRRIVRVGR